MPGMSQPQQSGQPLWDGVTIVGVGLIGGSIGAAIRSRGLARRVIGTGRNPHRLASACTAGVIDVAEPDFAAAVQATDLIIICLPVDQIVAAVKLADIHAPPNAVITDAGSTKQQICAELQALCERGRFVGAHPLAGSEKQGFEAATANLFVDRLCVVTADASTPRPAVELVHRFWSNLGASVCELSPADHDAAVAESSHLPHLAAAAVVSVLDARHRRFAATGFRDTTRVASGDAGLWTAILLQNRDQVIRSLRRFESELQHVLTAIEQGSADELHRFLQNAQEKRTLAAPFWTQKTTSGHPVNKD